ncbi:MAG: urease accessory protein UreD [Gammaproteobacteria bacterium]|nr:urease accessory protein UreD [Gammaproteobacteria bacterium]
MNQPVEPRFLPQAGGWQAALDLRFCRRRQRTLLAERHQSGPLLVQRPFYPEPDGICHTYLLHPPAGIVGGDQLDTTLQLEPESHALLTTPAATRWYFNENRPARATQHARLDDQATLEWLPQESLLFDGTHGALSTRIDLTGGARCWAWEILGFGRPASGETFSHGEVDFRFEVYRDGRPRLLERLRVTEGLVPGLGHHQALATLVASGADSSALQIARELCTDAEHILAAATVIDDDLLVCRALGPHCAPLTALFHQLWSALRPALLGRVACPPRIWRT